MFERFTERARKVMTHARQEAQRLNAEFISTEHMLLGILIEGGGVGAKALMKLGMSLISVKAQVEKIAPKSTTPPVYLGQIPFSPRAKRVIEMAGEEASRAATESPVGTEHLALALIQESEGVAYKIYAAFGITEILLRKTLGEVLGPDAPGRIDMKTMHVSSTRPQGNPESGPLISIRLLLFKDEFCNSKDTQLFRTPHEATPLRHVRTLFFSNVTPFAAEVLAKEAAKMYQAEAFLMEVTDITPV